MKKIGDVTSTADKNGEWTNGNVAAGIAPTILEAGWLNSVQREILGVLTKAGIPQDKNKDTQLAEAISTIISGGNYATTEDLKKYLAKDQNGADIPNKDTFIKNLGLGGAAKSNVTQTNGTSKTDVMSQDAVTKLADKKFDKTGGKITAGGRAIEIEVAADDATYIQITDTLGNILHQMGKRDASNSLTLSNVSEGGSLVINGDGVRFNGRLLGFINEALSSGNGWWRDSSTGFLIQWGETPPGSDTRQVKFPIPFKVWPHAVVHFDAGWYSGGGAAWGAVNKSLTGFTGKTSVAAEGGMFIAMGF